MLPDDSTSIYLVARRGLTGEISIIENYPFLFHCDLWADPWNNDTIEYSIWNFGFSAQRSLLSHPLAPLVARNMLRSTENVASSAFFMNACVFLNQKRVPAIPSTFECTCSQYPEKYWHHISQNIFFGASCHPSPLSSYWWILYIKSYILWDTMDGRLGRVYKMHMLQQVESGEVISTGKRQEKAQSHRLIIMVRS